MTNLVSYAVSAGVARLTLTRASRRNALTREMLSDLHRAVRAASDDSTLRLLRLEAEGSVFCAGMDLLQMQETALAPNAVALWAGDARLYRDTVAALVDLPIPTVAIVAGPAVAGGVGLVAACDLVLASSSASFSLPEPQRGITAAVVIPLLRRRVGYAAAAHLLLSNELWTADDALRWGMTHRVASPSTLEQTASELCRSILRGSPDALRETKRFLRSCDETSLTNQLHEAVQISAAARATADAREGLQAFLEKRPPSWDR